jgi:hypothetical protein
LFFIWKIEKDILFLPQNKITMQLLTTLQRYQILLRIIKELNTYYSNGVSYNTIIRKPPYNTNDELYYKSFVYRDCISFYVEHMKKCFAEPIDGVDVLHEYVNELRRRNEFYVKFSDDEVLMQIVYRFRKSIQLIIDKSFIWSTSVKGPEFWWKIYDIWYDYFRNNIDNLEEHKQINPILNQLLPSLNVHEKK